MKDVNTDDIINMIIIFIIFSSEIEGRAYYEQKVREWVHTKGEYKEPVFLLFSVLEEGPAC